MPERNGTDWFAWFLGCGFFGTVWLAMIRGVPEGSSHDVVLMLVTAVVTYTGSMVSFRYGSTAASEKKTDTITDMAKAASISTATAAAVQAASVAAPIAPDPVRVEVVGDVAMTTAEP